MLLSVPLSAMAVGGTGAATASYVGAPDVTGRVYDADPYEAIPSTIHLYADVGDDYYYHLGFTASDPDTGEFELFFSQTFDEPIQLWAEVVPYAGGYGRPMTEVVTHLPGMTTHIDVPLTALTPSITGTVYNEDGSEMLPVAYIDVIAYLFVPGEGFVEIDWTYSDGGTGEYAFYSDFSSNKDYWGLDQDAPIYIGFNELWENRYQTPQYYDQKSDIYDADPIHLVPGGTVSGIDAYLVERPPLISGTVYNEDGSEPLGGIDVSVYRYTPESGFANDYTRVGYAYSDSETGEYEIHGLWWATGPDTPLYIGFEDSGAYYYPQYFDRKPTLDEADPVHLIPDATVSDVDAYLVERPPGITGTVYNEDGSDTLSNVSVATYVYLVDSGYVPVGFDYATDSDGSYEIRGVERDLDYLGLPADSEIFVKFSVWDRHYYTQYYDQKLSFDEADPVTLVPGGTAEGIDAYMVERPPSITGTVYDESGVPAGDIDVNAWGYVPDSGFVFLATGYSDYETGEYALYGLDETLEEYGLDPEVDPVYIEFEDWWIGKYYTQYYDGKDSIGEADPILVEDGVTLAGIDAYLLSRTPEITGTVFDEGGDTGLEGIHVTAYTYLPESGFVDLGHSYSDAQGDYGFYRLIERLDRWYDLGPEAPVYVEFWDWAGRFETQYYDRKVDLDAADAIDLVEDGTREGIDAYLIEGEPTVSGRVTDSATLEPIEGVQVKLWVSWDDAQEQWWDYSFDLEVSTNEDGEYRVFVPFDDVAVAVEFYCPSGEYLGQFYDGKSTLGEADVLYTIDAPITGIDAELVDVAAPVSAVNFAPEDPDGNEGWYVSLPTVGLDAVDAGSGVHYSEYSLNSGPWTVIVPAPDCASGCHATPAGSPAVSGVTDGSHVLAYRSTDLAGNVEEPRTVDFKVDMTAPTMPAAPYYTALTSTSASIAWAPAADAHSGVSSYELCDDGVLVATLTGTSYVHAGLEPGSVHAYTVVARDAAGNRSEYSPVFVVTLPVLSSEQGVPVGDDVEASVSIDGLTFSAKFESVTKEGTLTVSPLPSAPAGLPTGFMMLGNERYDVSFTGQIQGYLEIAFPYDTTMPDARARNLKVMHWKNNGWEDVTDRVDTVAKVVWARVASLSPFVLAEPTLHTITASAGAGGTIAPEGAVTVDHGASQTFTVTPDEGYEVATVLVDGEPAALTDGAYTFTGVTDNHTIDVTFTIKTYTLTYTAGAGGTVFGDLVQTVAHGSAGTAVTAVPNVGYRFVRWSDGLTTAVRTDSGVTGNVTVEAVFAAEVVDPDPEPDPAKPLPPIVKGDNRFATAIAGSKAAYPNGAPAVVIATGEHFADALGGAGLAGALKSPLLLTEKASLPGPVMTEVDRLKAKRAYILGGTGAVSANVESALKSKLGDKNVIRIAGSNRYQTAERVAAETIKVLNASGGYEGDAFIATGANFPDALGASPVAASQGMPVFLADPARSSVNLPASVKRVWITGGNAVVSAQVEASLKRSLGNASVNRLAGGNRFETAAAVAKFGAGSKGMTWNGVGITTGMNFPDALAAGPVLGSRNSVMLLTDTNSVPAPTRSALATNKSKISKVTFFGGDAAVPPGVRTTVNNLIK